MAKISSSLGKLNKEAVKYEIIFAHERCAQHGLKEIMKWYGNCQVT